jgi:bla regulator protein BlaR1
MSNATMSTRRLAFTFPLLLSVVVLAQDAPSFEVASVRQNTSGELFVRFARQPGGRFSATNIPLKELIRFAYQVQNFQLEGVPDWADSERYDIVAKAEGDPQPVPPGGPPDPMLLMTRSLLADRFKLVLRHETREMPIYALTLARADRRTGPALKPSSIDCASVMAARGRGVGIPQGPPNMAERPTCGMRTRPGHLSAGAITLGQLVNMLSTHAGRSVVDRTSLTGVFDVDLTWTPDQMPQMQGTPPPGAPPPPPIDPNGPSLFTAIEEQLGLKLESTRGAVEVLVVERLERSTPD